MIWFGIIVAFIAIWTLANRFFFIPRMSPMPDNLGWHGDGFTDCPRKPNCVSSTIDENRELYVAPITFDGSVEAARSQIISIINEMSRTEIITSNNNYIHAVFRSPTMGYLDDVEFYFDSENSVIHARSAGRLGYSDIGANRNRIESIRQQFES